MAGLPFLPVYAWVGLWTSGMLMSLAMAGASNLIEYATQFTDDVFNALLSVNFIFEVRRMVPGSAVGSRGAWQAFLVWVAEVVGRRPPVVTGGVGRLSAVVLAARDGLVSCCDGGFGRTRPREHVCHGPLWSSWRSCNRR